MKVHPAPNKRNITLRYDIVSTLPGACRGRKNLRRLPHIFAKVLELPFHADTDVVVEETGGFFRFTVADTDVGPDVVAETVEILPGVTKIIVRSSSIDNVSIMELELDLWRFRLPEWSRPDLASASYDGGDLVVVVPKSDVFVWGGSPSNNSNSNFVLVN